MSRIKGKHTKPELFVRKYLHSHGIRYRINIKEPGTPDIAIRKIRTAIFVNGCFWHAHTNCKDAGMPKSNTIFWATKIQATKERDKKKSRELKANGWDVITIWECQLNNAEGCEKLLQQLCELLLAKLNKARNN